MLNGPLPSTAWPSDEELPQPPTWVCAGKQPCTPVSNAERTAPCRGTPAPPAGICRREARGAETLLAGTDTDAGTRVGGGSVREEDDLFTPQSVTAAVAISSGRPLGGARGGLSSMEQPAEGIAGHK